MATITLQDQFPGSGGPFGLGHESIWDPSAPRVVSAACVPAEPGEGWQAWVAWLIGRKKPLGLAAAAGGKAFPQLWALPEPAAAPETRQFLTQLAELERKKPRQAADLQAALLAWLSGVAAAPAGSVHALECVAVAYALPGLGRWLPPRLWWDLLGYLLVASGDAGAISLETEPLAAVLLGGEVPIALALLLPEIAACKESLAAGRASLSHALIELLDGEGLPRGNDLWLLRPLLAAATRCQIVANPQKEACLTPQGQAQYEWLVRDALRLTRYDGSQLLLQGPAGRWEPELFAAALQYGGNDEDEAAASLCLPGRKPMPARKVKQIGLPEPALHSEWSSFALLRPQFSRTGDRLAINYSGQTTHIELDLGREVVFSGLWDLQVQRDGRLLQPSDHWEEVCWVSDEEVDYLELEITLEGGMRVQRQMLLARRDQFLFLADAVLGQAAGELHYRGTLPLAHGIEFDGAEESREGFLYAHKKLALVMPLALPEWRADPRHGTLEQTGQGLQLRQHAKGRNLFCPLFIDLKGQRINRQLTWRQLTVAEQLQIQPADAAVGYRVQCAQQQWLFYRSLVAPANRTVLGQNLVSEFLAARFDACGDVEELIEIE